MAIDGVADITVGDGDDTITAGAGGATSVALPINK